jgi:hypothetical protein
VVRPASAKRAQGVTPGEREPPRDVMIARMRRRQNARNNPMPRVSRPAPGETCGARTRDGTRCPAPAMPNGRCRLHGGLSPGAPRGNRNAAKHGRYGAEATAWRREVSDILRRMRSLARAAREQ